MNTALLHTHKTFVYIFLAFYVLKLIALLINHRQLLAFFAKKPIRIVFDMVVPTVYLVTGVILLVNKPGDQISYFLVVKIAVVLLSIPIAVVGFRKGNKLLATLAVLLLFVAYGLVEMARSRPPVKDADANVSAQKLYESNCTSCHGTDGALMLSGAIDLSKSTINDEEIANKIRKGGNGMAAYGKVFSDSQILQLSQYVKTLRR